MNLKLLELPLSLRLVMKMILEITDQFLFCLVFLKCSKELYIRDFIITYRKSPTLYPKQFGFQKSHSTEHAILQPIDQINSSFEKKSFYIRHLY